MSYLLAQASAHRIPLRDESVQTCVTSPPYWGLRAYAGEQRVTWFDGTTHPLGLEPTPDLFVAHMVEVFREVWRVLRKDGTLWLNLGDSYAGSWGAQSREHAGKHAPNVSALSANQVKAAQRRKSHTGSIPPGSGLKPKDLVGIPWRVAFALQADGWYLRSDIVWAKPNPMPESVTDRPTTSHEYVFLLSKSERYFYDADAVSEIAVSGNDLGLLRGLGTGVDDGVAWHAESIKKRQDAGVDSRSAGTGNRNARSVWNIATQPYPGAHFATFPEALPERCIKAGSARGDVVLDPFNGSGTTGRVAMRLGRRYVGLDLSREYLVEQAIARIDPITAAARDFRNGVDQSQGVLL